MRRTHNSSLTSKRLCLAQARLRFGRLGLRLSWILQTPRRFNMNWLC